MSADVWYLDTSALVKRVIEEPESVALEAWLRGGGRLSACELVRVELVRAVRVHDPVAVADARALLATITLIAVDRALYEVAANLGQPLLRSLDALHVATALTVGGALAGIVTYDTRMAEAARAAGLRVEAPA